MSLFNLRKKNIDELAVTKERLDTMNPTEMNKEEVSLGCQVRTIFSDVKTEGRKKGYKRAAKEYERVLKEMEWAYQEIVNATRKQGIFYRRTTKKLLDIDNILNKEMKKTEENVEYKTAEVSKKYNIPFSNISSIIGMGKQTFAPIYPYQQTSVISLVYEFRKNQMDKAEQEGYQDAKEEYEKLIMEKKEELKKLQQEVDENTKEMVKLICDTVGMLISEKMKDADLDIML